MSVTRSSGLLGVSTQTSFGVVSDSACSTALGSLRSATRTVTPQGTRIFEIRRYVPP